MNKIKHFLKNNYWFITGILLSFLLILLWFASINFTAKNTKISQSTAKLLFHKLYHLIIHFQKIHSCCQMRNIYDHLVIASITKQSRVLVIVFWIASALCASQ